MSELTKWAASLTLPSHEKLVLWAICDSANEIKMSNLSILDIEIFSGLSRSSVIRALHKLEKLRLIRRDKTFGNPNTYKVQASVSQTLVTNNQFHTDTSVTETSVTETLVTSNQCLTDTTKKKRRKRAVDSDAFCEFWNAYPVKKGKAEARKVFQSLNPSDEDLQRIISSINEQKQERAKLKQSNQFAPDWKHPARWLKCESWNDEPSESIDEQDERASSIDRIFGNDQTGTTIDMESTHEHGFNAFYTRSNEHAERHPGIALPAQNMGAGL